MSRQPKISKVALARRTDKVLQVGNGGLVGIPTLASVVLGTIFGIPMAITHSVLFLLAYTPALIGLGIIGAYYYATVEMKGYTGEWIEVIYKILPKLGKMERDIAAPLIEKVYQHTIDRHPGGGQSYSYSTCKVCIKRVKVLRELIPNKATDESDMEFARLFIEERKKFSA